MSAESAYPGFVSPVAASARFLRIDQGVDWDCPVDVVAVGDGLITHVSPPGSWAGGTGQAVYQTLATPVVLPNGHSYDQVYYAERVPLVAKGDHVAAGEHVMGPGSNELGFARNNLPACPPVGGIGKNTRQTQCGIDFYAFVDALVHAGPVVVPSPGTSPPARASHAPGAWKQLTHALGHDLAGSLYTTQRVRHALRRRVR